MNKKYKQIPVKKSKTAKAQSKKSTNQNESNFNEEKIKKCLLVLGSSGTGIDIIQILKKYDRKVMFNQ